MKSLYNEKDLNEIISRIENLPADAQRQWGKMNVGQMLAHCNEPFKQVFGEVKLKRTLPGILFGGFAKKMVTGDKPFKQGLPTDKAFIFKNSSRENSVLYPGSWNFLSSSHSGRPSKFRMIS